MEFNRQSKIAIGAGILAVAVGVYLLSDSKPLNLVKRDGILYEVNSNVPYSGPYTETKSMTVDGQPKTWVAAKGYVKDGKFDGEFVNTTAFGAKETLNYKAGTEHGAYKHISEKGQVLEESNYINGKLNGRSVAFWYNGQKRYDCEFSNGVIKKECLEYDKDGALEKKSNIIENGTVLQEVILSNNGGSLALTNKSLASGRLLYSSKWRGNCKYEEVFYYKETGRVIVNLHASEGYRDGKPSKYIVSSYRNNDDSNNIEFEITELGECITHLPKPYNEAKAIHKKENPYY